MDRSDPRYTNALDPYFAKNVSEGRVKLWERVCLLSDERLMNELAAFQSAADLWLNDPAMTRLRRRAADVVHYRMVKRQVVLRMGARR